MVRHQEVLVMDVVTYEFFGEKYFLRHHVVEVIVKYLKGPNVLTRESRQFE